MSENDFTPEEAMIIEKILDGESRDVPLQKDKGDVITFLREVVDALDNTKTGNLDLIELGMAKLPVRTNQELSLYCKKMEMNGFSNYFLDEGQITLATSLSKEGFLDILSVTQKKDTNIKTRRHQNRASGGLFKKKEETKEE